MSEAQTAEDKIEVTGEHSASKKKHFPPCRAACPVHTDIQSYVWLIGEGRYAEALDVIRSVNPIASACSLICHHPCETECRRSAVDEPLAIRHLKRFALEQAAPHRRESRKPIPKTRGKSIGIIGSGPSGLTAADDLALLGYSVTLYEKNPDLGGMLSAAIPTYRLSREALKDDIDDVLSKGVEAVTNCSIGKDITFDELKDKHDALLIAVGLSESRSLPIEGVNGPGVLLAIPFLFNAAYQKPMELGKRVLVIGGGNVAIDVARTALRLGVGDVEMVCLENEQEIPAWDWEVEEAVDEGVIINYRWGPKAVRREGEAVTGLDVVKVTSVFDKEGRFSPSFDEKNKHFIEADTIIITIGQMSNLDFLKDSGVTVEKGRLQWDQDTQMSSVPGIFVSGEVVTGPGSAIQAAANGHRVAKAIHLYLEGKDVAAGLKEEEIHRIEQLPPDIAKKISQQKRENVDLIDPAIRCKDFVQIEIGYDEITALSEARRCRSCGGGAIVNPDKCMACLTCLRICPYDAPVVTNKSEISPHRCQACGLCAPECPGRAISMFGYDIEGIKREMPKIIGQLESNRIEPLVVAFLCSKFALDRKADLPSNNVRIVQVHCASRIDTMDIMAAFENGADGVSIVLCDEGQCRHPEVTARVIRRIGRTREVLEELGLGAESLDYIKAGDGSDWRSLLLEKVGALRTGSEDA